MAKELEKNNKKQLSKDKLNKENKPSIINIQKQRNTVSAVNIITKNENNPPKYRASHHVETTNEQANPIKF